MNLNQVIAIIRARADESKAKAAEALDKHGVKSKQFLYESGRRQAYEDALELISEVES